MKAKMKDGMKWNESNTSLSVSVLGYEVEWKGMRWEIERWGRWERRELIKPKVKRRFEKKRWKERKDEDERALALALVLVHIRIHVHS